MRKHQKGFAHYLLLVSAVVVVMVVVVGIRVSTSHKKVQPPSNSQTDSGSSSLSVEPLNTQSSEPAIPKKYLPLKAAVDQATTPAGIQQALVPLANDYGIVVNTTHYTGSSYMQQNGVTWQDITTDNMDNAKAYADWFIAEWAKYPTAWVSITRIKHIVFVNKLLPPNSSTEIGGTNDLLDSSLYLNISNVNFGYDYGALTIHHEFAHLIDYNFWGNAAQKAEWEQLNPPGFSYVSDTLGSNPTTRDASVHPRQGFVSGQSLYDFQEDRAETYGFLFTTAYYKQLVNWLPQDPYLTKKVAYYKAVIAARVPSMNDAYFNAINK